VVCGTHWQDIYALCKMIKSQILTDFVAKWTDTQLPSL
jgi:hypothetical protein